jgi:predicted nucleic acid-binding protein
MTAYVDSSLLLRVVFRQADALAEWPQLTSLVSSILIEVECLRTIDRLRQTGVVNAAQYPPFRQAILGMTRSMRVLALSPQLLTAAAEPMAAPLGTLDAIHLVTALRFRQRYAPDLVMVTHHAALANAAAAHDLPVLGT